METQGETFRRLVAALEILAAEEQCVVREGEIDKIRAVLQRADPIVARIGELRNDPAVGARETGPLLPRLAALQSRRASSLEMMNSRLAEMSATLAALDSARGRLGQLRNAYAQKRRCSQPMFSRLSLSA
jgi:hypothetical protein